MVTAYESIKNKLSATEIYDIKQGGLIDAEIRAYAVTDLNSLNLWQEPI